MIPLTLPEVRRLLQALRAPPAEWARQVAWSTFRRRHQARAARCHRERRQRAQQAEGGPVRPTVVQIVTERWRELNEALWERIQPLLPPQKPPRGRPGYDQQRLLGGMLWVMQTGAHWREVPGRFAPWHTVYACYQRWRKAGIWQQIVAIVRETEPKGGLDPQVSL